MIKEQLGSALSGSNIKKKTQEFSFNEVGKGNIESPTDAILGSMDITKDLGEEDSKEQIIKKPIKKGITSKLVGKTKMKTPIGTLFTITKEEIEQIKNETSQKLDEKWSKKYKDSIDCKNPKGFSQRAHCQGKKKKSESNEATGSGSAGGFIGPVGFNPQSKFVKKSFEETPKKVETKEQEDWTKKAQTNIDNVLNNLPKLKDLKQFGLKYSVKGLKNLLQKKLKPDGTFGDNKWNRDEMPFSPELDILNVIFQSRIAKYYFQEEAKKRNKFHYDVANLITKESLDNFPIPEPIFISVVHILTKNNDDKTKIEATEATGSGSAGSYVTPAAWAKTMNKKDWRGKSKTQIPGGQFVQVKKKCKKFPYCNQGDIKALNLSEEKEILKQIIKNVSEKYDITESLVIDILRTEYPKLNKQK